MEQVTAWKPKCCNKVYLHKRNARRHEQKCPFNPDNKACATCGYNNVVSNTIYVRPVNGNNYGGDDYEERYFWCDYHEKEISKYGFDEEAIQPQKHCEHWKPKEVEEDA